MEDLSAIFTPVKDLLLDKQLKDSSLLADKKPITIPATKSFPIDLQTITFTIGAGLDASIILFNEASDTDPDGLVSAKDGPISLNPATEAILKYGLQVTANANAEGQTTDGVGFNMDLSAKGSARMLYYSRHANTEGIKNAFGSDIKSFANIFRFAANVDTLQPGNAVAFMAQGSLCASISVSWSNIFSQSLTIISGFLPAPLTLDIDLTPTLTGTFTLTISDNYSYVVKKEDDKNCLVNIHRKKSRSASGTVGFTVKAALADSAPLVEVYDCFCKSVFHHTATEISQAITQYQQGTSDSVQSQLVKELLKKFDLGEDVKALQSLSDKLTSLHQDIIGAIQKLAASSIEASVTYQYQRIQENETVLSISLPTTSLAPYHSDLLKLNSAPIIADMRKNEFTYTLHSFLQQDTTTITQSFGFGFKLFNLLSLSSKGSMKRVITSSTNEQGNPQYKIDQTAGIQWAINNNKLSWLGDFTAAMPAFANGSSPTLDEFKFALQLDMITEDPKVTAKELSAYLDSGVLWGSVLADNTSELTQKYSAPGNLLNSKATIETKLNFDDKTFRAILQRIASNGWNDTNKQYLAKAMAASMSWNSDYKWRANPAIRQNSYNQLWLDFLNTYQPGSDADYTSYGEKAYEAFLQANAPDNLAEFEHNPDNWTFGDTFAGLIRSNPGLYEWLKGTIESFVELQELVDKKQPYDEARFTAWLNGFTPVFNNHFVIRTLGYFMLLHCVDQGLSSDPGIQKILTFSIGDGAGKRVVNFAAI